MLHVQPFSNHVSAAISATFSVEYAHFGGKWAEMGWGTHVPSFRDFTSKMHMARKARRE